MITSGDLPELVDRRSRGTNRPWRPSSIERERAPCSVAVAHAKEEAPSSRKPCASRPGGARRPSLDLVGEWEASRFGKHRSRWRDRSAARLPLRGLAAASPGSTTTT